MINTVFNFLKDSLSSFIKMKASNAANPIGVGFPSGTDMDPINFTENQITVLMIKIEEEKQLRPANRYILKNGKHTVKVKPPVYLNLYALFVAKYTNYEECLKQLSFVVQYFQQTPIFLPHDFPYLPKQIEKLEVEHISPSFTEQNEIWGSLRVSYHPSILYRLKMLVYQDIPLGIIPEVVEPSVNIRD